MAHDRHGIAKTILRFAVPLVPALWLSACGLSPAYVRPELGLPETYARGDDTVATAGGEANRDWWREFSSEPLLLLQKRALDGSRAFQAERHVLSQALSRARAARADLFPGIQVAGSATRRGNAASGGYQVNNTFSGSVQASYEIDIWGKNFEATNAAAHRAIAGLYAWRGAGLTLESETALTYFAYLAARENLTVYDAILRNAREVLAYQKTREQHGAVAALDVARQRASVSGMEAGRISYQIKMVEAGNSLCLLIGAPELPPDIAAMMEQERLAGILPPPVAAGLPSDLLLRRPDVAGAEAGLMAANADIGVARAAFLPSITLSGSAGRQSGVLHNLLSPANALDSLAGSLMQPVFQGGRLKAQYEEAIAAHKELMERYRQAALAAFLEVAAALDANRLLQEQEAHRIEAAAQAAESYRLARLRYEAGAEDFLDVLNAQETLLAAENQLVQSRLERLNTVVALFKALGGGWGNVTETN